MCPTIGDRDHRDIPTITKLGLRRTSHGEPRNTDPGLPAPLARAPPRPRRGGGGIARRAGGVGDAWGSRDRPARCGARHDMPPRGGQAGLLQRPHRGLRLGRRVGVTGIGLAVVEDAPCHPGQPWPSSSSQESTPTGSRETACHRAVRVVADAHVQIRAPRAVDVYLGRADAAGRISTARTRARRPRRAPPWRRRAPRSTRLDAVARPAGLPVRPRAGREPASRPTPSDRAPGASSPAHPVPGPRRRGFARASRGRLLAELHLDEARPALVERGDARAEEALVVRPTPSRRSSSRGRRIRVQICRWLSRRRRSHSAVVLP